MIDPLALAAVRFRKASRSSSGGGNCVLVGRAGGAVLLQDSKEHPDQTRRTTLAIGSAGFAAFLDAATSGRFQR